MTMADDKPQQQQIQFRIDESKMHSTYANTIRTSNTQDEVVMDFGLNLPMQAPNQAPTIVFNVGSRVIMNWAGAKRLVMSLGNAVRQYEEQFGTIELTPAQAQNRGGGGGQGSGQGPAQA
jgi:hypothetical protein